MMHDADIIIAEDNETLRKLLSRLAEQRGFSAIATERGDDAMALIRPNTKVVILDLNMPGWNGFQCLEWLAKEHPNLPAIILTAADEVSDAVKAMKMGALDYINKPFDAEELFAVIHRAIKMRAITLENETLREEIVLPSHTAPIACSITMKSIVKRAEKMAALDSNILITGESGTGKGVLARYIHSLSPRATKPFVTVSCPALPRELLESELFGHEKGAFTGAIKRRAGKIELAKGGTLFLDEIGDMPLDIQPKLLNVLQDRIYQRVGGEENIQADIRIIAATNAHLGDAVKSGSFREDLYYRLNVLAIENPPLRERPEDISALIDHSLDLIRKRRKCSTFSLSTEAHQMLITYSWPGNVRQLENVMEQASAFCENHHIEVNDLPAELHKTGKRNTSSLPMIGGTTLEELEKEALLQTLAICNNNRIETARMLGISEKSVYNMIRRYGVNHKIG